MKHLRKDWDGIQDTAQDTDLMSGSSIEAEEPVFLLRAKDPAASATVMAWTDFVEAQGGNPELIARVRQWAREMLIWRQENYPAPKVADTPKELLR